MPAQGKIGGRPAAQYVCRRQKPIRPSTPFKEQTPMRTSSALRAGLIALATLAGGASAAYADSGGISFSVIKAGIVIGGSAGSGTLSFHGRQYPLGIGGLSYGFTFGASETHFRGTVSHISGPGDVSGVYAAGNVGAALGRGARPLCSPTSTARCWSSPATRSAPSSARISMAWSSR